jgi:hypothetical protein
MKEAPTEAASKYSFGGLFGFGLFAFGGVIAFPRTNHLPTRAALASRAVAGIARHPDSPQIPVSPAGFLESRRGIQ